MWRKSDIQTVALRDETHRGMMTAAQRASSFTVSFSLFFFDADEGMLVGRISAGTHGDPAPESACIVVTTTVTPIFDASATHDAAMPNKDSTMNPRS